MQGYAQARTAHARGMDMEQLMQTVPGLRPPRKLHDPDPVQSLRVCRPPLPPPTPQTRSTRAQQRCKSTGLTKVGAEGVCVGAFMASAALQVVLGLGTGRCGTLSLWKLLSAQDGATVTHEVRAELSHP